MEHGKKQFDLDEFLEKYKVWIGGGLIVLILAGAGLLIWRENYSRPNLEAKVKSLEERIGRLETDKRQETSNNNQTNSNTQNTNAQTAASEQGAVAGAATSQNTDNSKQITVSGKVNINTASVAQLDTLPGIGPAYAQRIIDYRNAHGAFKTIDELDNVKGIGKATIDKLRDLVIL